MQCVDKNNKKPAYDRSLDLISHSEYEKIIKINLVESKHNTVANI